MKKRTSLLISGTKLGVRLQFLPLNNIRELRHRRLITIQTGIYRNHSLRNTLTTLTMKDRFAFFPGREQLFRVRLLSKLLARRSCTLFVDFEARPRRCLVRKFQYILEPDGEIYGACGGFDDS
jgi:hypothetical protein